MLKIDVFAVLFMNELKNLTNTKKYVFCAKKKNATQILELKSHRKGEVYSIQHYVIKFVSDLCKVGDFLWVHRFPPPFTLTSTI